MGISRPGTRRNQHASKALGANALQGNTIGSGSRPVGDAQGQESPPAWAVPAWGCARFCFLLVARSKTSVWGW